VVILVVILSRDWDRIKDRSFPASSQRVLKQAEDERGEQGCKGACARFYLPFRKICLSGFSEMEYRSRSIMDVIINSDLVLFIGFASRAAATAKAGRSTRREYEPRAPCRASAVRYKLHGAVRSQGGSESGNLIFLLARWIPRNRL